MVRRGFYSGTATEGKGMVEVGVSRPVWALGLMSGTSMDGVDAAFILTDGESVNEFGPSGFVPFSPHDRKVLNEAARRVHEALDVPNDLTFALHAGEAEEIFPEAVEAVRANYNEAIRNLCPGVVTVAADGERNFYCDEDSFLPKLEVIGIHGQTLGHRPEEHFTLQLGSSHEVASSFASQFGVPVVYDFRTADMKAGGEGAPLAPFYHFALARRAGLAGPVAFLNLGGVANVTWIDPRAEAPEAPGAMLAFDTGPANALIDDFMAARTGKGCDADGARAALGVVADDVLAGLPGFDYLDRRPPKSLDRNDFLPVLDAVSALSTEDGAATLAAFTADCVAAARAHMPRPPARWLVCGGGRRNLTMMRMLGERLEAPVAPVEAVGLDGDMLEAQAFAYLAVRVLRGLPTSAPGTTGCRAPVSGGRVSRP